MTDKKPVWRRKQSIVNPRQQIWFALEMLLVAISFVVIVFLFLFLPPMDSWFVTPDVSQEVLESVIQIMLLKWPLVMAAFMVMFTFGLLMSHRLSGPLFSLGRATENWVKGNRKARVYFRKYDYLLPAKAALNAMFSHYEDRLNEISQLSQEIANSTSDPALKEKAQKICDLLREEEA